MTPLFYASHGRHLCLEPHIRANMSDSQRWITVHARNLRFLPFSFESREPCLIPSFLARVVYCLFVFFILLQRPHRHSEIGPRRVTATQPRANMICNAASQVCLLMFLNM